MMIAAASRTQNGVNRCGSTMNRCCSETSSKFWWEVRGRFFLKGCGSALEQDIIPTHNTHSTNSHASRFHASLTLVWREREREKDGHRDFNSKN